MLLTVSIKRNRNLAVCSVLLIINRVLFWQVLVSLVTRNCSGVPADWDLSQSTFSAMAMPTAPLAMMKQLLCVRVST